MKLLLTRSHERSVVTGRRLKSAGHDVRILPLTRHVDLGHDLPAGRFDAIVFTSATAITLLAARGQSALTPYLDLPAWCVGPATLEQALKAGFSHARETGGDAENLAVTLADAYRHSSAVKLFCPGPAQRSLDLAQRLPDMLITQMVLYESKLIDPGADALEDALGWLSGVKSSASAAARGGGFLVFSRRMALHLASLGKRHGLLRHFEGLTAFAISENVGAGLGDLPLAAVRVALVPTESALLDMIKAEAAARKRGPA